MIVATAGHVDHGKTLLVKMLTGMDCDRLEEEKRRGLSINLGFAYRKINQNKTAVFIDVPGHTRFINNMIAGINGIDIGMLVVAADDGPMPQTREHMDVLKLLGVTQFVLVISKIDRVDKARVEVVRQSAMGLFPETAEVPVFEVNSLAGEGIQELEDYLSKEAKRKTSLSTSGYFRLSIDRAFLIKGSGLVVTGTVAGGSVEVGETVTLLPQNIPLRIRSIQIQEQQSQQAQMGQRCALDISGDIEKDDIERGDWLVATQASKSTTRFDAKISLLEHMPFTLKHMSPVKLYIGAKRIPARLALLDKKSLASGQECYAQVIVKRALHCCTHDRFLIRDDSENETLGGGLVLDPYASAGKRSSVQRLLALTAMEQRTAEEVLESLLFDLKQMVNLSQFFLSWNSRPDEEADILRLPRFAEGINIIDIQSTKYAVASMYWDEILEWIQNELETAAQKNTEIQSSALKSKFTRQFPGIDTDLVFTHMQNLGSISVTKDRTVLSSQQQRLSEELQSLWTAMEKGIRESSPNIPALGELTQSLKSDKKSIGELIKFAIKEKWLVAVADNRLALAEQIKQFAAIAQSLASQKAIFSVADFKNECGIGRNLAVEVLEYFDKIGFTMRKESGRVVLKQDRVTSILS
ncbi:MAG: selenocysteine-specific elongation factor [Planctomycetota bacterium]